MSTLFENKGENQEASDFEFPSLNTRAEQNRSKLSVVGGEFH